MMSRRISFHIFVFFLAFAKCDLAISQISTADNKLISTAEMDQFLKREMDSLNMPGLSIAIVNNGKIVYHRALGVANIETQQAVTDQSIFEAASLSKSVFAYLVMKMADKGIINIDTPLYKYMPYPDIAYDKRYKLITARMVLSHQSGFPNWRFFPVDSGLNVKQGQLYLKFTPGTEFSYSGEGYLYLAKVIAHLNHINMPGLEALFEKYVADPLGMKHSSYVANAPYMHIDSSYFNPAASLQTNALEYARFLMALMNDKGLSKESIQEMLSPQFHYKLSGYFSRFTSWGLGFGISQRSSGVYYEHPGNNGNFQAAFVFNKKNKFGYVFFTNCDKGDSFDAKLSKLLIPDS